MSNPLYNQFGRSTINNNEISQIINMARQVRQSVANPRQEVERLLQSGQMTQQQFNQFAQIANQLTRYF